MASVFYYKTTPYFHVYKLSMIGKFNNYDPNATPLKRNKFGWRTELDLPKGKYVYKFLINDVIKVNDPNAAYYIQDKTGEVWSVAVVNSNQELSVYESKDSIYLQNHSLSNKTGDYIEDVTFKNTFNLNMDAAVFAGFLFGYISGLHTITAVWYTPQMLIHHISDHIIEVKEGDYNNSSLIWFWISLQDDTRKYQHGIWNVKLLVDGDYIMEEKFSIDTGGIYIATNQGIMIKPIYDREL